MFYIDSHCHLTDKRYSSPESVVKNAENEKVRLFIDIGWNYESTEGARRNAQNLDGVFYSAGIHPSESLKYTDEQLRGISCFLNDEKCVAVGEIGLDYHYDDTDKSSQKELFEKQILMANERNVPFIVHSRDASADMLDVLSLYKDKINNGFLMHCYSESKEQAKRYLDLGAYFAFGGVVTFKNSKKDDVVRSIPLNRLLAETDSPYMAPESFRGSLNEPKNVVYVYKKMAEILGADEEVLKRNLYDNFLRLFTKIVVR